jgi:hypothetical protein
MSKYQEKYLKYKIKYFNSKMKGGNDEEQEAIEEKERKEKQEAIARIAIEEKERKEKEKQEAIDRIANEEKERKAREKRKKDPSIIDSMSKYMGITRIKQEDIDKDNELEERIKKETEILSDKYIRKYPYFISIDTEDLETFVKLTIFQISININDILERVKNILDKYAFRYEDRVIEFYAIYKRGYLSDLYSFFGQYVVDKRFENKLYFE